MSVVWCGLAPHPPIIIETVGGKRRDEVAQTVQSMRAWSSSLLTAQPDHIIVISPHTPRPHHGIGTWMGTRIKGSFAAFGAPATRIELDVDTSFASVFAKRYRAAIDLGTEPLDHGAMVPLHFVMEAGWDGPTNVLGLPWQSDGNLDHLANTLAESLDPDRRTALIASGDMSHCLTHHAPCGYDPNGALFDQQFSEHLRAFEFKQAIEMDRTLCEAARQDVVAACHVALQAISFRCIEPRFYSYEGPFGVGYCVMRFSRHD